MILSDILAEVDERYPNGLSNDSKVRKLNNLQAELFRTEVKRTVATTIDMVADVFIYFLDVHPTRIREVLVDGNQYEYKQLESEAIDEFWYVLDDALGIYPVPTTTKVGGILLFHYQEPTLLSSGSLSATPDLDPDFHTLLVYGLCKELAEIDQRFDIASGFAQQYNAKLELFKQAVRDAEPDRMQMEMW